MELEKAIEELKSLSPSEIAIETVLKYVEKLESLIKPLEKQVKYWHNVAAEESIPKKVIEDKIKKLTKKGLKHGWEFGKLNAQIEVLQDLLKGEN